MKLKGINPIEQHVEKIVLAGASAACLLVVAMQFTTQPNLVQPDAKGRKLPPAKAFEPAKNAADLLKNQLTATPAPPESPKLTLLEDFKAGSERPLLESDVRVALGEPAKIGGGVIAPAADGRYAEVVVPTPAKPVAAVFEGALDPSTIVQYPELKANELVPAAQPYDKASVSVEATFSGTQLRAALELDPDGPSGELRPIPIQWWRDGVEVLGVQVERSQSKAGGEWSEPVAIGALPGRVDLLGEIAASKRVTVSLLRSAVEQARVSPDAVLRPDYFPYLVGEPWIPPSDAVRRQELDERRAKIDRINEQIAEIEVRLASLESELASAPTSLAPSQPPPDGGGGGGGGKGGAAVGGGGGREPSRPSTGPDTKRLTKAQVQRQIDSAKRDRDSKQSELVAMGVEPTDPTGTQTTRGPQIAPTLLETPDLKVWGHDITVARGETYRYRVRVLINNPAFGNALSLPENQRAMAESPTLASGWTEWTPPVTLDPMRTYFVTSASVSDAIGGMRASASIFEFYYGYWRVGSASLTPGDPLEAKLRLPAPELMPIFDETQIALAPAQRPGFSESPQGEREGFGGSGKGGISATRPSEVAQPSEQAQAQLPPNSVPGPKDREAAIDAVYLSTASVPVTPEAGPMGLAAGDRQQVYLRSPSGLVIARMPEAERASETYRRMERSAKLGERQGVPVPKVEKPKPVPNPGGRNPSDRPDTGGGGGGGGG